jgi:hypothetical protein
MTFLGAAAPQQSRVSASLRSTSPLRSEVDKPLTAFTPLINKALIGLSPKALSIYFSLLITSLSEV